ncbi:putative aminoadipate-semialdehyde dehydrogenase [Xylogone sp. PMI_703]|nr:putative aminoadipate-semialdehyde dehydrogenase [Xylogone sp. PMI_703]
MLSSNAAMSRAEVDQATLSEIAAICNLSMDQVEDVYGCTPLQLEMITGTRAEVFHIVLNFGPLADRDRFCDALRRVVSLNSILRTRFVECSFGILQVVTSEEHVTKNQSRDVEEYLRDDKAHCLTLGAPVFRSAFFKDKFVATIDHTVMDYWSLTSFLNEDVMSVYYGLKPKIHRPFRDFVTYCQGIDESIAKSFWGSRFKNIPAVFPKVNPGFNPRGRQKDARKIALRHIGKAVSPSHIPSYAEAAWALTTAIYADSESITFGTVLSGRSSALNGVETTLGPMIAEVPVQVNLHGNMSVEQLIKDRVTSLRQLQIHSALQYGIRRIAAVSEAARIASGFQTLFNIRPAMAISAQASDEFISFDRLVWPQGPFALDLICSLLDDGILVETRFDPLVICERQVDRVLNEFEHILRMFMEISLQTKLNKLQLLNPCDYSEIFKWKTTVRTIERSLHEVFIAQAEAQPEALAVEAYDETLNYVQLNQMSDRLAHELRRKGMASGDRVALIFEKSLWAIVAILGTLKAGGVCVPIDKYDLAEHKAAIVSNTGANVVLTSSVEHVNSIDLAPNVFAVDKESIAALPEVNEILDSGGCSPEDLAYIIFTSSSTGAPKGVMIEHRCLVSSLNSLSQRLGWQPGTRVLQFSAYVSSMSMSEIFGPLLSGGCLCIPFEATYGSDLSSYIRTAKINSALLTPSVLRDISLEDASYLQTLVSVGERIDATIYKAWNPTVRLFKGWSACETSTVSVIAELVPESPHHDNIGTPVGCAAWIVNPQNINQLIPIGGVGELLINGPGVARGYLNNKAETSTSFVSAPLWASSLEIEETRFYRTGDLARYNPDGSISLIGRIENRVKLGDQKVQLEELESTLADCIEVKDVMTSSKIVAGRTQLLAVISLADPHLPCRAVLQKLPDAYATLAEQRLNTIQLYARSRLPSGRVPTIWLVVEQLPRTVFGKLDRAAVREWLKIKNPTTRTTIQTDALKVKPSRFTVAA